MTNVGNWWLALAALWFIAAPGCGDTTGNGSAASATNEVGGTGAAGETTGGVTNAGAPSSGGVLSVGGYGPVGYGGLPMVYGGAPNSGGGYPVAFGGYPVAWGGGSTQGGSWNTGGRTETGGAYSESPPNGATCLCRLAESLRVVGGWQTAGCTSDDPNNCTLEKAYCGQTCAADATCALACFADFPAQVFNDAATYSYGTCNVIIRCPAPSS